MKILGIDYGRKKIGLAIATTTLAEPFGVIRVESQEDAVEKIVRVVKIERVKQVVVGISEGKMAEETKAFANKLEDTLGLPIVFRDETLSTQEAQRLSIEANISQKKRHEFEDAYSATIILQDHLNVKP